MPGPWIGREHGVPLECVRMDGHHTMKREDQHTLLALVSLQCDLLAKISRLPARTSGVSLLCCGQQSLETVLINALLQSVAINWAERRRDLRRVHWWWAEKRRPVGILDLDRQKLRTREGRERLGRGRAGGWGGGDRDLWELEREAIHGDGRTDDGFKNGGCGRAEKSVERARELVEIRMGDQHRCNWQAIVKRHRRKKGAQSREERM